MRLSIRLLLYLVLGLVIVGLSTDLSYSCLPGGDYSLHALHLRDVIYGDRLVGAYSRFGFAHLGPAFFYLYAPGLLFPLSPFGQMAVPQLVLHLLCLYMSVELLARLFSSYGKGFVLVAVYFFLVHLLFPRALGNVWGPIAVMPAFLVFVVSSIGVLQGKTWWTIFQAVSGAIAVQGHLGILPVAAVIWIVSSLALIRRSGLTGGLSFACGSIVGVILFFPALYDALAEPDYGNLGRIASFIFSKSPTRPFGEVWASFQHHLVEGPVYILGIAAVLISTILSIWKREFRIPALICLLGLLVTVLALTRTKGEAFPYLFNYLMIFFALGIGLCLISFTGEREWLEMGLALALVGYTLYAYFPYTAQPCRDEERATQVVSQIPAQFTRICLVPGSYDQLGVAAAIAYWLSERGTAIVVPPRWAHVFGAHRVREDCGFGSLGVMIFGNQAQLEEKGLGAEPHHRLSEDPAGLVVGRW